MTPERIIEAFPAPSFRPTQKQALTEIREAFAAGNQVVLVRAPTGSGKSLLARAIMGCARDAADATPAEATGAYYTTPQVSQLDDVAENPLLSDLQVIRGKRNYTCILPDEQETPVDRAPCVRESGFDCDVRHRCPYFSQRAIAASRGFAAMTVAYFMRTAGSDVFRTRDVAVIDEAHGLAEWAEMYATIDLGPRTLPVWDELEVPTLDAVDEDPLERTVRFADTLSGVCERAKDEIIATDELTPEDAARRDQLQELKGDLEWFLEEYRDPQSPTTWVVDQVRQARPPESGNAPLTIKPMNPERYLKHTVWDRGNRFALLSATILNKAAFCRRVGLDTQDVALVDVEHTFPLEHRPLYDVTQGKMTYEEREETVPKLARLLVRLMAEHPDEKGIVHAHSYDIQASLAEAAQELGVGARIRTHGREDRDETLESWLESEDPEVFLSVKMEEALDLADDLARWQLLCKAPFLNTGDSRVARRLEDGQWAWYYRAALRTVIQACGRVVRSPEDYGGTYIGDSSVLDLFERVGSDMPGWFQEQVDAMSHPDLPEIDPSDALAGHESWAIHQGGPPRPTQRESAATAGGPQSEQTQSAPKTASNESPGEDSQPNQRSSSPLADVWDGE